MERVIFKNEVGSLNFALHFKQLQETVPQDRFVDEQYQRYISKSLLDENKDPIADDTREIFKKYMTGELK